VGWHCYVGNEGSIATALSAGFEKAARYPAYWVSYDRSVALGVQGNQRFEQKAYLEAAAWYLRAIEENNAPAWIYWNAACAYANLDQQGKAFIFLKQAVDHGFDDAGHIKNSPSFEKWHASEEWGSLINRL
jgi:tetratricopeptide (TPR) repeat protein